MPKIKKVFAREVIDSRGNPTIEVDVLTESGAFGRAIVPSGASTGEREALELRDGDKKRFNGKGVLNAVKNVNVKISKEVIGISVLSQSKIDELLIKLDGTEFKSNLGANAVLGVSLAVCKAAADYKKMPLYKYISKFIEKTEGFVMPVPMINIINGGAHADSSVDFQEYMIVPVGAKNFKEAVRMGSEVFHSLKSILKTDKYTTSVGDEGGFAPNFASNEEPFDYIVKAITKAGYEAGKDICLAIDVAASEFFNKDAKVYYLSKSGLGYKTSAEMVKWFEALVTKYPIISIEDPLDENDNEGWAEITKKLGKKLQIVGDDLFVTNPKIFAKGIKKGLANAILIKLNQIGTLTETFIAINLAKKHGYKTVISHRSGETEDVTIADLAVSVNAGQIKTGSICRTDRVAKYNQLIRIEEELGKKSIYGFNKN